jgi:hypothetical protein
MVLSSGYLHRNNKINIWWLYQTVSRWLSYGIANKCSLICGGNVGGASCVERCQRNSNANIWSREFRRALMTICFISWYHQDFVRLPTISNMNESRFCWKWICPPPPPSSHELITVTGLDLSAGAFSWRRKQIWYFAVMVVKTRNAVSTLPELASEGKKELNYSGQNASTYRTSLLTFRWIVPELGIP